MILRTRGFTYVELIVVLALVALGIILLLPALGARRGGHSRPLMNANQLRGIHSGLFLYAQDNKSYYPGFTADGKRMDDYSVEYRFQLMLDENYFTGEYIISPSESKTALTQTDVRPTTANYSYAMLNLSDENSPRNDDWQETSNSQAVMLSDRAILGKREDGKRVLSSVQTSYTPEMTRPWEGAVAFNDNHVERIKSHILPLTAYGWGANKLGYVDDNLFDTVGASMVYQGIDDIIDSEGSQ
ncbi:MAG: type II secretion system protein [Phycisphaeraceae bacterium JB051]